MSRTYTEQDEKRLQALLSAHRQFAQQRPPLFVLRDLFSDSAFDITAYCQDFRPNPHALASEAAVKQFAQQHNVWVERTGDYYNSMTAYLNPTPNYERLTAIGQHYAVLFYMNDVIGREKIGRMTPQQRAEVRQIVANIEAYLQTGVMPPASGDIERAMQISLEDIRVMADQPQWYATFVETVYQHIEPSFFDRNARAQGQVMTIDAYIDCRLHVSGMVLTVALMEFGDGEYIDYAAAEACGLLDDIRRAQWLCAAVGALMNDMFSFEKEFITEGSDFNLVTVTALNHPDCSLEEVVIMAAERIKGYIKEFTALTAHLDACCDALEAEQPALVSALRRHLKSIIGSVQATWVWENETARYKHAQTIFAENVI